MKKLFTRILLFFIDKELLFDQLVSKQEFHGQKLLNAKLLTEIEEIEKFHKLKYDQLMKTLRGLNIFIQESYVPKSQFCLIQYTNLKGEPDILITDLSKINQAELHNITDMLKQSTNLTISKL